MVHWFRFNTNELHDTQCDDETKIFSLIDYSELMKEAKTDDFVLSAVSSIKMLVVFDFQCHIYCMEKRMIWVVSFFI